MKYHIVLVLLLSAFVQADAGIAGKWTCEVSVEPRNSQMSLSFDLSIDEEEKRFIRNGFVRMQTGIPSVPEFVLKTKEEGTVSFGKGTLTLSPLSGELSVVEGKPFIKDNDPAFMSQLIKDETGDIKKVDQDLFTITFVEEETVQTNTCERIQ